MRYAAKHIGGGMMKTRDARLLGGLATLALLVGVGVGTTGAKSGLRATNAEVRILSQSSFQGEIEPCG
jgi:hypothetical protein